MNRQDFVKEVSAVTGDSQKKTKEVLDAMQTIVFAEMAKCEEVKLFEGVTFTAKEVPETMRRNPATGGEVLSPKHNKPVIKFGKAVKEAVNA